MQSRSPIRKCVGCGARRDKIELLRVVNNKGDILIDPGERITGRGAYLCPNMDCLDKAVEKNSLKEALKIDISDEIYDKISEEIKHG
ncbi:MAG: RNase P modulator RnpM [Bacillota bacterium]